MSKFQEWFNGKKTIIGTIASLTIGFCQLKGYIDLDTSIYLYAVSGTIFSIGVGHKIKKALSKK